MTNGPLAGHHALITGGGRGIGAAISRQLAQAGASITLLGRDPERLTRHAHAIGGAHVEVADVTSEHAVNTAIDHATTVNGNVTILVNNAGQALSAPAVKTSLDVWQRMLDVNLTGAWLCTHAALPGLIRNGGGRIINIASTAGLTGYPYVSAYCAAKHGLIGLTRALAVEFARRNITVNAVCPGFTETDLLREAVRGIVHATGRSEDDARQELTRTNPQGRLVQPDEVAHAVLMLCLPGSASITGQAIAIAGGEVLTG